jgi:hypothetical protein
MQAAVQVSTGALAEDQNEVVIAGERCDHPIPKKLGIYSINQSKNLAAPPGGQYWIGVNMACIMEKFPIA